MKKKVWVKIAIGFFCAYVLGVVISDNEEFFFDVDEPSVTETTTATEAAASSETTKTTVPTEPKETTEADRVGVSEKELHHILNAIYDLNYVEGSDYDLEDIDLIRKDSDILVEFEEYIVFMKDGEVIRMNVNKALLEE